MTDMLGQTIGQYQVIEFIARGDSAFVYKGFQPNMNRYVAVKILPPSLARNPETTRAFHRQGELMAQLEHRYILPVYDYGRAENVTFIVARYIETGTLKDDLAAYHDLAKALKTITMIAEGLDFAHEQGLVHGNLKSSNILINAQSHEGQCASVVLGRVE